MVSRKTSVTPVVLSRHCQDVSIEGSAPGTPRRAALPSLLPGKTLVEKGQDFGHVELDVFEVEFVLVVFLHLEQVVKFEVQLQ